MTSTTGLRAELFALDDLAAVPLARDILGDIGANIPISMPSGWCTSWCAG